MGTRRVLARLEGVPETAVEALVAAKFEYVVACQKFSDFKASKKEEDKWKARSIDELRHTFPANLRVAYVELTRRKRPTSRFCSAWRRGRLMARREIAYCTR